MRSPRFASDFGLFVVENDSHMFGLFAGDGVYLNLDHDAKVVEDGTPLYELRGFGKRRKALDVMLAYVFVQHLCGIIIFVDARVIREVGVIGLDVVDLLLLVVLCSGEQAVESGEVPFQSGRCTVKQPITKWEPWISRTPCPSLE